MLASVVGAIYPAKLNVMFDFAELNDERTHDGRIYGQ